MNGIELLTLAIGIRPEYAYIYNKNAQVVALEKDIVFGTNGVIVGSITHTPDTSTIQIGSAGDYEIWFYTEVVEPNQFALFKMAVPLTAPYMAQGTELKGIRGW